MTARVCVCQVAIGVVMRLHKQKLHPYFAYLSVYNLSIRFNFFYDVQQLTLILYYSHSLFAFLRLLRLRLFFLQSISFSLFSRHVSTSPLSCETALATIKTSVILFDVIAFTGFCCKQSLESSKREESTNRNYYQASFRHLIKRTYTCTQMMEMKSKLGDIWKHYFLIVLHINTLLVFFPTSIRTPTSRSNEKSLPLLLCSQATCTYWFSAVWLARRDKNRFIFAVWVRIEWNLMRTFAAKGKNSIEKTKINAGFGMCAYLIYAAHCDNNWQNELLWVTFFNLKSCFLSAFPEITARVCESASVKLENFTF